MNIFFLDYNPYIAARLLTHPLHRNKMLTETAQILATALHLNGCSDLVPRTKDGTPYKPTHENHPCVRWVASNRQAWAWTTSYGKELYSLWGKFHQSGRALEEMWALNYILIKFDHDTWVEPPMCMPESIRIPGDVVTSYRCFMVQKFIDKGWDLSLLPEGFSSTYWKYHGNDDGVAFKFYNPVAKPLHMNYKTGRVPPLSGRDV